MWHTGQMFDPLVHPDALHFDHPVTSYWEASATPPAFLARQLANDTSCDVAIIGGGFTGLSAALELATQGEDVRLLEAGQTGWGASGRNGGFACIGSHKLDYGTMINRYGPDATRQFYSTMRASIDLVSDNLSRHTIDGWKHGQGEVQLAHLPQRMATLQAEQQELETLFGEKTELLSTAQLQEQGLAGPTFHGGLRSHNGFGIHPLNYARGLAQAAIHAGANLHQLSSLLRWEQQGQLHKLYTPKGTLTAKRVLIATNGYTLEDLSPYHAGRILPVLSTIIVTRELTEAELRAQGWWSSTMAYDSRNLLHYFRLLPNNRFLFGSRGGTDSSNASAQAYGARIMTEFREMFPAWRHVEITHNWRGHVCLSYDRVPFVGALDEKDSVWTALAYHGNGVAMASWCGRAVARMMTGIAARDEVPKVITRRLAKFPLPQFRPLYLKGAYLWYGLKDSH